MINNILKAPLNLYFDTTPLGRILNKFSKDLNQLETDFGYNIGNVYVMFFSLMYSVIISIFSLMWLGLLIPFILLIGLLILKKAKTTIKEVTRLTATTKSPMLSHLSETISGSSTIRAFGQSQRFHG